jgi:hypothetical protein
MSALFAFAIAGFFAFLGLLLLFKGAKPYNPPRHRNFTAAVKYGELQAVVHYESTPDPFEPRADRIIGLWAINREDRKESEELWLALEAELKKHFPESKTMVSELKLKARPEETIEPAEPTLAEYAVSKHRSKKAAAIALVSEDNSDVPDVEVNGTNLRTTVKESVASDVTAIFHHPDRQ